MMKITKAKPFLKWAGGKTQLIAEIDKNLPREILEDKFTYVEPFIGSGAVMFWMISNFPKMEKAVINDINADLINTYEIVRSKPQELISILKHFQNEFYELENQEEKKKEYYYAKRDLYNTRNADETTRAALFIFLNRTCFNGLYRVNRSNNFNVPMGSYKLPMICDEQNILAVSKVLQKVIILESGDFEKTITFANEKSFFYLDPPYKPLNATSSFNSYSANEFNDNEQIRLRDYCVKLNNQNAKWVLSNSHLHEDNFFENLFEKFNINIVKAKRAINSKGGKRGSIDELLVTNFPVEINQCAVQSALF